MRRSCPHTLLLTSAALFVVSLVLPRLALADPPQTLWEELNSPITLSATGAYDPVRHQMVMVVQGLSPGNDATVWAYDFSAPTPQWKHLLPYNSLTTYFPSPDWGMVYDPLRDRFITTAGVILSTTTPRTWQAMGSSTNGHRNSAVYDPFLDRLVNYDGNGTVQTLKLSPLGSWTTLSVSGTPPPNRSRSSVIFDTDHRRLIVFGGGDRNDVWALTLTGAPTWSRIFPISGPPAPRSGQVAVFDARHRRMIMMGGEDLSSHTSYTDTWELSLVPGSEQWSLIDSTPSDQWPAVDAAAADDSLNDRMIVYAAKGNNYADVIQSLSLGLPFVWTRHSPQTLSVPVYGNPAGSVYAPTAYDSNRHQLLEFSGKQLWALPLAGAREWQQLTTATTGPDLGGHAMIYDPANDRLVMFGGIEIGVGYSNKIYTLTLSTPRTWGTITPSGSPPTARRLPCAIYDPVGQRMIIFGGRDQVCCARNDTYGISLTGPADWTPLPVTGAPIGREGSMAVYDSKRQRLVIHGGQDSGFNLLDETWALPLDGGPLTWSPVLSAGTPPLVKSVPAAYDARRDRMVVIPGNGAAQPTALSFADAPTWSNLTMFGGPTGVTFQDLSGIYDPIGDQMVALSENGDRNPWALRFAVQEQLGVGPDALPGQGLSSAVAISALRPNPTGGPFSLEYSLPAEWPATAEVFDVRGRRVYRRALAAGAGPQHVSMGLPPALESGVYFVRVAQAGKSATSRVAIVH